jgi:6-pyruvoyl-tetrahydropterin synthase
LGKKGYPLHGHDVLVNACIKGQRKGLFLYDIEELKGKLGSILSELNYADLARKLGVEEASLEDLVSYICEKLQKTVGEGLKVSLVEARVPSGSVRLQCD